MKHFILVFLLLSCISKSKRASNFRLSPGDSSAIANWKSNQSGCDGNRSYQIAERIMTIVDTLAKTNDIEVADFFGKPDDQYGNTMVYYLKERCDSLAVSSEDVDVCRLEVTKQEKGFRHHFICK
ncbi:MAG: hypothetical protein EOO15_01575 [Chitinophagaceae bacterium]|nr:MAG: hypothetical protein EOO15_01575 [Chitinophagaceae bacterium]